MAYYISPGVYVNEIDKSTYISGVPSSVAYTVLRYTYKGPEMVPTLITSEGDLTDNYGIPLDKKRDIDGNTTPIAYSYQDMLSSLGYLQEGMNLYAVRVLPESATFAGTKITSAGTYEQFDETDALTLKTEVYSSGDVSNPDEFDEEVGDTLGSDGLWLIAKDRGYWGNNLRVGIVDKTTQTVILSGGTPEGWSGTDTDVYNSVAGIDSQLKNEEDLLLLVQEKPQKGSTWSLTEVWNVSLDEDSVDSQGQTKFIESLVNSGSRRIRIAVNESAKNGTVPSDWITEDFKMLGGGADFVGDDELEDDILLEAFELASDKEQYEINIFIDSNKSETVKQKMIEIAEDRMDVIVINDCLYEHVTNNKGNEAVDIVDWRKGIVTPNFNVNTSYAALYGNWLEVYDKYNQKYRWIPASGHMAGIYAYTDRTTDPWFAPAGLNRGVLNSVRRLAWNPNKAHRDKLYLNGVNPIVSFAGKGKVVWGQKTLLDENSAFDRVNVRRLFMVMEKAISESSQYFVFQPNDRDTRRRLVSMIDPFLADIKSRRGVYDYLVVCNTTNNTPERIDRSELWCDIFIKPTKAAEFIVLNFIATRTGVEFAEV